MEVDHLQNSSAISVSICTVTLCCVQLYNESNLSERKNNKSEPLLMYAGLALRSVSVWIHSDRRKKRGSTKEKMMKPTYI